MTERLVFRRDRSGKFDLSESALREVVGDSRVNAAMSVHWPLAVEAESEFLATVAKLHFENPTRSYAECHKHVREQRPLLFTLSWVRRASRDDSSATFQVAGEGAA